MKLFPLLVGILSFCGIVEATAQPLSQRMTPQTGKFSGVDAASVRDMTTGVVTSVALSGNDVASGGIATLPDPGNGGAAGVPITPPDTRLAKLYATMPGGAFECSSGLIAPRLLITAGHCVYNNGFATDIQIIPGYNAGYQPPIGTFKASRIAAFTGWISGNDHAHDIGLIELDHPVPVNTPTFQTSAYINPCANGLDNLAYLKEYYDPEVWNPDRQAKAEGAMHACFNGMFWDYFPTHPGSSGSAAFLLNTNNVFAVTVAIQDPSQAYGFYAFLTQAKNCFLVTFFEQAACDVPLH
jgi:V8-like Glu-specific endopeptidase